MNDYTEYIDIQNISEYKEMLNNSHIKGLVVELKHNISKLKECNTNKEPYYSYRKQACINALLRDLVYYTYLHIHGEDLRNIPDNIYNHIKSLDFDFVDQDNTSLLNESIHIAARAIIEKLLKGEL